MGNEWQEMLLGDVITLQRGFDLPQRERKPGKFPVITSSGVNGTHSEAKVSKPGVVTGRYGTIGEVFYITEDFWPHNTTLFVKDFKNNHPLFISFLLRTINFQSCSDKSSVPGVNRNDLHRIKVKIPPLHEQKAIAHILGTIDDKIELDQQMNQTLEAMARTIFKSWFVDFDPVRAKMEGKQTVGMDEATAALFPNSFEESELGLIPKGWEIKLINDICQLTQGYSFKSKDFSKEGAILVRLGNFTQEGMLSFTEQNTKFFNQECKDKFKLKAGDLVMCLSDVTQKGLILGKTGFIPNDNYQYLLNQRVAKIETEDTIKIYLHFIFTGDDFKYYAINTANATTVLNLSSQVINEYKFLLPKKKLLELFVQYINPILKKKELNIKESWTLINIRDTLLPKLMSGEIRVKEAEKIIEEEVV